MRWPIECTCHGAHAFLPSRMILGQCWGWFGLCNCRSGLANGLGSWQASPICFAELPAQHEFAIGQSCKDHRISCLQTVPCLQAEIGQACMLQCMHKSRGLDATTDLWDWSRCSISRLKRPPVLPASPPADTSGFDC